MTLAGLPSRRRRRSGRARPRRTRRPPTRPRRTLMGSLWHNSNGRTGCVLVGLVLSGRHRRRPRHTPYPAQSQDPSAVLKSPVLQPPVGHGPVRARPFLAGPAGPVHIGQDRLRGRGHRRGHRDRGRDRGGLPRPLDGERHHAGHGHDLRHPGHPLRPGHRDGTRPGLAEQRPGHRHRLHTHLRPGGAGAGPRPAGSRLRAGGPGARVLPPPASLPPHLAQRGRDRRRADQPGPGLVGPGRGQPQLPRPRAAAAHGLAGRDGEPVQRSGRHRLVDAGRTLGGHRHRRYRLQFPRRRPAGRHRPPEQAKKLRS